MSILINFRIDEKLKKDLDKVCKACGLTMSAAFNMFATEMVKKKTIPLDFNLNLKSGISLKAFNENLSGMKRDNSLKEKLTDKINELEEADMNQVLSYIDKINAKSKEEYYKSRGLGIAKGKIKFPDDIDLHNEEIAKEFYEGDLW